MRCGDCSLCCKLAAVPEFGKPVYEWCIYCSAEKGCSIYYSDRPLSCASFECYWYLDRTMAEDLRPDKCNVMFERLGVYRIILAEVNPEYPNAWTAPRVKKEMRKFLSHGFSLAVNPGPKTNRYIFLADGVTQEQVLKEMHEFAKNRWINVDGIKWQPPAIQQT